MKDGEGKRLKEVKRQWSREREREKVKGAYQVVQVSSGFWGSRFQDFGETKETRKCIRKNWRRPF